MELDSNYKPTDDVVGVCIFLFQYFLCAHHTRVMTLLKTESRRLR